MAENRTGKYRNIENKQETIRKENVKIKSEGRMGRCVKRIWEEKNELRKN